MFDTNNFRIEKMQPGDLTKVAELLTDSFETNPAYSLIFDGTGKIREGLFWLFKNNLLLLNRKQIFTNIIKEPDSENIIGTFTLLPPEGTRINFIEY